MTNDEDSLYIQAGVAPDEAAQHAEDRLSRAGFFRVATASALGAMGALMYTAPTLASPIAQQGGTAIRGKKVQSGLYYIKSELTGFVLDIPGSNRAAGTLVSVFPQNSPFSYNQLWLVSEDGYIQSLLNGLVLDVTGGSTSPRTPVQLFPKNVPPSPNQHWFFSDGYIYTALDGMVLDVNGSDPTPGAKVIVFPTNAPRSNNQQWTLVPAF